MTWKDLEPKYSEEEKKDMAEIEHAKTQDLAKAYKRLFTSDDGLKVIADLSSRFIYNNTTNLDATNPNYESAFHNGERGVVQYCHQKMASVEQ